jgi:hypothetical protein
VLSRLGRGVVLAAAVCAAGSIVAAPASATHNADVHSDNMALVANFNDGGKYRQGSDLAFWGDRAILGNYDNPGGFRIFDVSNPATPQLLGQFKCFGPQSDVSVWNDLVFVSVDTPVTAPECGATAASAAQYGTGAAWEGIRVVSIANPAAPVQLAAVKTDCGSHTHTLVPDEANGRVLIYALSYPLGGQGPNCNAASHRKFSVVEVPLANPTAAKVVSTPTVAPSTGCHDVTVLMPLKLAGAACITESQLWDISDPVNPRIVSHIVNPAINIQHSTTFSWSGKTLVIGDELGGAEFTPGCGPGGDHVPIGALWFYDVSDPANPTPKATWRIPQTVATVFCTAHNFNTIPLTNGKDILTSAWYNGGTVVLDFSDPTNPKQLGGYIAKTPVQAATWSAYWYNGRIFGNNFDEDVNSLTAQSRGFDVMTISHPDVAGALTLGRLNPQTQEAFATPTGLLPGPAAPKCVDRIAPASRFIRGTFEASRTGLSVYGRASDRGCGKGGRGHVEQVKVSLARRLSGDRCRFLQATEEEHEPHFGSAVKCRTARPYYALARGTTKWRFRVKVALPAGTYLLRTRALDSAANLEKKTRLQGDARNFLKFTVR